MRALLLPVLECRAITGVERFRTDIGHENYVTLCHRWKGHLGDCKPHTRHSYIESYYDINRSTWPDLSRRRALWSAWKCWRMTRKHVDHGGWFAKLRDRRFGQPKSVQNGGRGA